MAILEINIPCQLTFLPRSAFITLRSDKAIDSKFVSSRPRAPIIDHSGIILLQYQPARLECKARLRLKQLMYSFPEVKALKHDKKLSFMIELGCVVSGRKQNRRWTLGHVVWIWVVLK